MNGGTAYGILAFYGILSMITAAIGHFVMGKPGFTYGYIAGLLISVWLWFSYGKPMSGM